MSGNEASAIGSMRAINTAQQSYSQQCNGFATVLTELKTAGNFLSPDLTGAASVVKSGFTVTMAAGMGNTALPTAPAGCTGTGTNYYASAAPLSTSTGTRARLRPTNRAVSGRTTPAACLTSAALRGGGEHVAHPVAIA